MRILAHRGWWTEPSEKNTWQSFERAFSTGYGLETDVRDRDGTLVIAHDMPRGQDHILFDDVLRLYKQHGQPSGLAINVKADGLHEPLALALQRHSITNAFVFDMAVPDALGYLSRGVTTFTRHSEVEPSPPFYEQAHGVWIDCFFGDWITPSVVDAHRGAGKAVALVSPELHRRPHRAVWDGWRAIRDPDVLICTDFPRECATLFDRAP